MEQVGIVDAVSTFRSSQTTAWAGHLPPAEESAVSSQLSLQWRYSILCT